MVLAARRLPADRRAVLTLAHRPHPDAVSHVYVGPVTPSGRFAAAGGRTVCHARTRRLGVLEPGLGLLDHDRRVCARCLRSLAARALPRPVTREQSLAAYRGMTLRDLALGLAICRTEDDTYSVGFVTSLLFGPPPARRPRDVSVKQALYDLTVATHTRRKQLRVAGRSPAEVEAILQQREADEFNAKVREAGRRQTARIDKLVRRANEGLYLTGQERHEIGMTG